jgi:uncharacterized protein
MTELRAGQGKERFTSSGEFVRVMPVPGAPLEIIRLPNQIRSETMNPLQRLLSRDDKFFDLLEASAIQASDAVVALQHLVTASEKDRSLDGFATPRRREKEIAREIGDLLCTTFVANIERDDIEALTNSLYKIPKTVEKVAERLLLVPEFTGGIDLSGQVKMLQDAARILLAMIQDMRRGVAVDRIRGLNEDLQNIEGELDKVMLQKLKGLYQSDAGAAKLIYLKDLYELLERVADRFRDAGVVITHMVLRNS